MNALQFLFSSWFVVTGLLACPLQCTASVFPSRAGTTQDPSSVLVGSGMRKYEAGDYEGAIKDFTKAIQYDSENAAAFNGRGLAQFGKGNQSSALRDLDEAISLDSKVATYHFNRGIVRSWEKSTSKNAVEDFSKAIELKPDLALAYWWRAHLSSGDQVLVDLDKCIELDRTGRGGYQVRHEQRGKSVVMVWDFRGKKGRAYEDRAPLRKAQKDLQGALEDLDKAIKLQKEGELWSLEKSEASPYLYYLRGCWRFEAEQYKEALEDFQKTADAKGTANFENIQHRAELRCWLALKRLGEEDQATQRLSKYRPRMKASKDLDQLAGHLLGQTPKKTLLDYTASKASLKGVLYFYAGMKSLLDGDKNTAKDLLKKCADHKTTKDEDRDTAKAELERLRGEDK